MENIELFALYEVRKGLYLDAKNQISKVQTTIAKLNTTIRAVNTEEETHGKKVSIEELMVIKNKKEQKLKKLYTDYSYDKKLYYESKKEIEELKILYEDDNIFNKEKNIFYIYFYSQFIRPRFTLERISRMLGISYEYTRKLNRDLFNQLAIKINELKKCYTNIT